MSFKPCLKTRFRTTWHKYFLSNYGVAVCWPTLKPMFRNRPLITPTSKITQRKVWIGLNLQNVIQFKAAFLLIFFPSNSWNYTTIFALDFAHNDMLFPGYDTFAKFCKPFMSIYKFLFLKVHISLLYKAKFFLVCYCKWYKNTSGCQKSIR